MTVYVPSAVWTVLVTVVVVVLVVSCPRAKAATEKTSSAAIRRELRLLMSLACSFPLLNRD
jgi:hypothetical protein